MADAAFPDWAPPGAIAMVNKCEIGRDIGRTLLTDPRMEKVWKTIRTQPIDPKRIDALNGYMNPHTWEAVNPMTPIAERACAAVSVLVMTELGLSRSPLKKCDIKREVLRLRDLANECRSAKYSPLATHNKAEIETAAEIMAEFFERKASLIEDVNDTSPYTVERSSAERNDDLARVKTRAVAVGIHRIFGSCLYETLTTLMNVALRTSSKNALASRSVRNWCSDLAGR